MDVRTSIAFHKVAINVADFGALASAEGVPLALVKGDHQVVVLLSQSCCNHPASRAVPEVAHDYSGPIHTLFDTAEHIITTAGCTLQMTHGKMDALVTRLSVGPGLTLTYGQVIGLGGDFYGDPNHPVCNAGSQEQQIAQFSQNFQSLASSAAEVKKILNIAQQYEFNPINQAVAQHHAPSGVYAGMPTTGPHLIPDEDRAFDEATGGNSFSNGRYLNLALSNLDHFGEDAMICYMAGHILAQRQAVQAKKSPNPDSALGLAYAINAFADHFLTDLFAAGHMRTPRRKLYDYSSLLSATAAGICAKGMHDEDNKLGLWVKNARGDSWVAYGDARYRDSGNAANRQIMKMAIQQSMNDVWNAYATGTIVSDPNCAVFQYLPTLIKDIQDKSTAQASRDDRRNWAPLFWWNPSDNYIYQRESLDDVSVRTYDWKTGAGLNITAGRLGVSSVLGLRQVLMPQQQYARYGYPYPPNEAGPSGEVGWPALGATYVHSVTGPDLHSVNWQIDGTPGPTAPASE